MPPAASATAAVTAADPGLAPVSTLSGVGPSLRDALELLPMHETEQCGNGRTSRGCVASARFDAKRALCDRWQHHGWVEQLGDRFGPGATGILQSALGNLQW